MSACTYKGYTLAEAKTELETWKDAKRAAATGKSYQLGSRTLTRQDLTGIDSQISYFAGIVDKLNSSSNGGGLIKVLARVRR